MPAASAVIMALAHRVPGKWHPNTIRDGGFNPLIAGIKEYAGGPRVGTAAWASAGHETRGPGFRPDRPAEASGQSEEVRVWLPAAARRASPTSVPVATAAREMPSSRKSYAGTARRRTNPDRYPLSTRVIDLTEGCGSVMHGIPRYAAS